MKPFLIIVIMLGVLVIGCEKSPTIRVATFNIWELSTEKIKSIEAGEENEQLRAATTIIQKVRPDILVINEIDHDYDFPNDLSRNARLFRDNWLNRGDAAVDYPYVYAAPCNTGIRAGFDFDNDGVIADSTLVGTRLHGVDCFGYGAYPGQYSMALLSRFPIDAKNARTFQKFLWQDLPDNHIPPGFYSKEELAVFRLSSKSHWDVPIRVGEKTLHLFLSHPTPPGFDGPEDRNGRRNFDEIKFWVHYIENHAALYDDNGVRGGYSQNEPYLIAGDMNAAPDAPPAYDGINAITQLLSLPNLQDPFAGVARNGTAQFGDRPPMRIDYLLPSKEIRILDQGVFWPKREEDQAGFELAEKASDHRLVWVDIIL